MRVVLDCSLAVVVFDRLLGFGHDGRKRRIGGSFEQANPEQSGDAKLRDPRGWPGCRRGFLVLLAARSPRLDFAPHALEEPCATLEEASANAIVGDHGSTEPATDLERE